MVVFHVVNEGCTVFAQLTSRESSRDIKTCSAPFGPKLHHTGIRQPPSRGTLADANEKRDWRIFACFAGVLIQQLPRATPMNCSTRNSKPPRRNESLVRASVTGQRSFGYQIALFFGSSQSLP